MILDPSWYRFQYQRACDPETPEAELAALFEQAYTARFLTGAENAQDDAHALTLLATIARNPNCAKETYERACFCVPLEAIKNPILPLLILEGQWEAWRQYTFHNLREVAFQMGHETYSALAQVCYPTWHTSWKIVPWDEAVQKVCLGDKHCARCFPEYSGTNLILWKRHQREQR